MGSLIEKMERVENRLVFALKRPVSGPEAAL